MTLHDAILELARTYGDVEIINDIVYVTMPGDVVWDFTVPMITGYRPDKIRHQHAALRPKDI